MSLSSTKLTVFVLFLEVSKADSPTAATRRWFSVDQKHSWHTFKNPLYSSKTAWWPVSSLKRLVGTLFLKSWNLKDAVFTWHCFPAASLLEACSWVVTVHRSITVSIADWWRPVSWTCFYWYLLFVLLIFTPLIWSFNSTGPDCLPLVNCLEPSRDVQHRLLMVQVRIISTTTLHQSNSLPTLFPLVHFPPVPLIIFFSVIH